jgi:hypothetical protein
VRHARLPSSSVFFQCLCESGRPHPQLSLERPEGTTPTRTDTTESSSRLASAVPCVLRVPPPHTCTPPSKAIVSLHCAILRSIRSRSDLSPSPAITRPPSTGVWPRGPPRGFSVRLVSADPVPSEPWSGLSVPCVPVRPCPRPAIACPPNNSPPLAPSRTRHSFRRRP